MISGGTVGMAKIGNRSTASLLAGIFIFFWWMTPAIAEQLTLDSEKQFHFARSCMEKGQYQRAITELDRFIYFFPHDTKVSLARHLIGVCYLEDGRLREAREVFSRTIIEEPESPFAGKALFLTGESYYREAAFDRAAAFFGEVLNTDPSPRLKNAAHYRLGWTRMQENRWSEASEDFRQVERGDPLYPKAAYLSDESLKGELLPRKDPLTAGVLAGILPGLGHAYVSRYKDALVAFLLNGLFIWATVESFHQDHQVLGGILAFFEAGWYTGNIYSAVNVTHKWNRKVRDDFRRGLSDGLDIRVIGAKKRPAGLALTFRF
jgi:tetratricopeptide (TPR) repeat protein